MTKDTKEMIVMCLTKHIEYIEENDPVFYFTEIQPAGKICGTGSPERAQGFAGTTSEFRDNLLSVVRVVWPDARYVRLYITTVVEELTN